MNNDLKAKIGQCPAFSLIRRDELELIRIEHSAFTATVALQGAQLLSFQPKGEKDWLWLSPLANFKKGQAIRGGIPICLPWFGINQQNPEKAKHGFLRNRLWQLEHLEESQDACRLVFSFNYESVEPELFEHTFDCQLTLELSDNIHYALQIKNKSHKAMPLSFALHSYFAVDDIAQVNIAGLENKLYLDNTQGLCQKLQAKPLNFAGEVDRVFEHLTSPQQLVQAKPLTIDATAMPSCIVWNPGEKLATEIADIQQHYTGFVCIERGAAFADSLLLASGEKHHFSMTITE